MGGLIWGHDGFNGDTAQPPRNPCKFGPDWGPGGELHGADSPREEGSPPVHHYLVAQTCSQPQLFLPVKEG